MSVLPIHTYGSAVLRAKAKPVESASDEIVKLIVDMFETMHASNGIGLAANQVGRLQRVIVIDVSDAAEELKDIQPFAMINPVVVSREGAWTLEEGCLSIPDVRDDVERAESITVRYKDANFEDAEMEAHGLLGRVILHEIDHLNGVLFIDHLTGAKRKAHGEALKKIQRGEIEVGYPVTTSARIAVS
jgi:peptide deformylase